MGASSLKIDLAALFRSTRRQAALQAGSGVGQRLRQSAFGLVLLVTQLVCAAEQPEVATVEPSGPPASSQDPASPVGQGLIAAIPTPEELERRGAIVGHIEVAVDQIFNEADPLENRALYRLANRWHRRTRDSTVLSQVLLKTGQPYSVQRAQETARILRSKRYLYDADVEITAYDRETNTVGLLVRVRDVWTLNPGIGVGRSGGENKSQVRIVEQNFLGLGQYLALGYTKTVDRSGVYVNFRDENFLRSWWAIDAGYIDSSDGSTSSLAVTRPFYSLDTRWSAGVSGLVRDQITALYDLGDKIDEFRQETDLFSVEGGVSRGLSAGWTTRWLAGFRYDRNLFREGGDDPGTLLLPEDRTLSYPWVGVELVQDRFETTHNQDQIGRTEDVFLGRSVRLELGWSSETFGGDRSAGVFDLSGRVGDYLGRRGLILVRSSWDGRLQAGNLADSLMSVETRYYLRFNEKNLFTTSVGAQHAFNLDLDHQLLLGGDSGLRGYPLRYQAGETRLLLSVEERYFTDWFPFRLFNVGGAIFADVGQMWGKSPLAAPPLGWLPDVGFGLRLGNARSGLGNVLHADLAFPIGAPSDISSVQFLLEVRASF